MKPITGASALPRVGVLRSVIDAWPGWVRTASARRLACAALIVLSELPILRSDYLFSDDYYWFDILHARPADALPEITLLTFILGRPVHGLLLLASFPILAQRSLWFVLRVLGIALMLLTAGCLARVLRRAWTARTADWVATAVVSLPGFVLYSYWLIALPNLLAAVCGALGLHYALEPQRAAKLKAAGLLILGLANYQAFSLGYFALLGLFAALGVRIFAVYTLGSLAVAVYFILARLLIVVAGYEVAPRAVLVFEPVEKARWLVESALPFAAKLWWIALPSGIAAVGLVGLVCWGMWSGRRDFKTLARRSAWVVLCAGATVLPHLSVNETAMHFRTILPLSLLIALLAFAALERWRSQPPWLVPALVACLLVHRATETWKLGIVPERALVLETAHGLQRAQTASTVYVVRAGPDDFACAPRLSENEFTAPSSQHDFAPPGLVRLASELTGLPIPRVLHGTEPSTAAWPQIDLRSVAEARCRAARSWFTNGGSLRAASGQE